MSPTIVFDLETHTPVVAVGSPGGPRIISYVLDALISTLDGRQTLQYAVSRPHVLNMNGSTEIESDGWTNTAYRDNLVAELRRRGHVLRFGRQDSGLHGIQFEANSLISAVDPRGEGCALGE